MALILPNSVFLHCPKAGGSWVRAALRRAGLPGYELGSHHGNFGTDLLRYRSGAWFQRKLAFLFVRHPLTWYQSIWAFRLKWGWSMTHPLDYACASNQFPDFVRRVLRWCPEGWLTKSYSEFADHAPAGMQLFVGRQERLQQDLLTALGLAGERFDRQQLLATPVVNDSQLDGIAPARLARYPAGLAEQVLEAENMVVQRWYPEYQPYQVATTRCVFQPELDSI